LCLQVRPASSRLICPQRASDGFPGCLARPGLSTLTARPGLSSRPHRLCRSHDLVGRVSGEHWGHKGRGAVGAERVSVHGALPTSVLLSHLCALFTLYTHTRTNTHSHLQSGHVMYIVVQVLSPSTHVMLNGMTMLLLNVTRLISLSRDKPYSI